MVESITLSQCILLQNVCPEAKATIMGGGRGGFAERFRGSGNLAVKIPDAMQPADAAPMLCAGITVWSPIAKYVTRPGMKVSSKSTSLVADISMAE